MSEPWNESMYRCQTVHQFTQKTFAFVGLTVDSVLDEALLHDGAEKLVAAWPVLGGQIHRSTRPWPFSTGSTVDFSSRKIEQGLSDTLPLDLLASTPSQPTPLETLKVEEIDEKFIFDVAADPVNVFMIRVTFVQDATLVCFGISHHLADGSALHQVTQAYCDVLSGHSIAPLVLPPDARGTKMSELVTDKNDDPTIRTIDYAEHQENFTSGFLPVMKMVSGILWSYLLRVAGFREHLEDKFICLPAEWVDSIRQRAIETLQEKEMETLPHDDKACSVFAPTKNDIINAWLLKTLYHPLNHSYDDAVDFYQPVNYRSLLQSLPMEATWIHNSIGLFHYKTSIAEIQHESIENLACKLRQTTLRHKKPSSVREHLRYCEDTATIRQIPQIRGCGNMPLFMVTSWAMYDFKTLDFSGASREPTGRKVNVTFVNPMVLGLREGVWPRAFTMKEGDKGLYWLRATNTPTGWENFSKSAGLC